MRRILILLFLIVLSACTGAPFGFTPTPTPTATPSATPSLTPTAPETLTPTLTATETETPIPTLTPLPMPARVLIVSFDGLRPEVILGAPMPTFISLMLQGAYTLNAQTNYPSITLVSHTSMLTGLCPADHGVDWNDYLPERGYAQVDSIFSTAHDQGLKTVFIIGKQKLSQITRPENLSEYQYINDRDTVVAEEGAPFLAAGFDLAFVHFPTIDMMGHKYGWLSPEQLSVARRADEALGTLLAALEAGGLRDSTLIILTADHGGHETTHGTNLAEDMTIPWVMTGRRVIPQELLNPVNTTDTAATVAWVLKLPYGGKAVGQPILEGFGLPVEARPELRCP